MDIRTKDQLSLRDDSSIEACAIRLSAARKAIGMAQQAMAEAAQVKATALNNAEKARNYPNMATMLYLHRYHGIDFNFMIAGDYSRLPAALVPAIFDTLAEEHRTRGRTPSSSSPQAFSTPQPHGT